MKTIHSLSRYISPENFRDVRLRAGLTRKEAARLLDVAARTIQNWETGGARIPWMAFRMLRILCDFALPGDAWEGWTVCGDRLYSPNGYWFEANTLEHHELVYSMARLWRQDYARRCQEEKRPKATRVLPFPVQLQSVRGM